MASPEGMVEPNKVSLNSRQQELMVMLMEKQLGIMKSLVLDDLAFGGSDLLDALRRNITSEGGGYVPINVPSDRRGGLNWPIWRNETELGMLRQKSRVMCASNPYGKGMLRNTTAHVMGKGGNLQGAV